MDGNSHINEIIINDENKFDYFLKKLDSINFSVKSYKLVVVTCYFSVSSIKKLITNVDKRLKEKKIDLAEIELFLDKREFYYEYSLNYQKFQEEIVNHFKERVTFKIPKSSQLFHPKAYCLMPVKDDINIKVAESGLFFGSANLSGKGFGDNSSTNPNLELMYFTVDGKIISDFYRSLRGIATYDDDKLLKNLAERLKILAKKIEEESNSKENSLYKWRLINEGNFVYLKSEGTIEYNLEISYEYETSESDSTENKPTEDKPGKAYYFWNNNADDSNSTQVVDKFKKSQVVDKFKKSNEYREIVDIFLRHNPTYQVNWGERGINVFGNYYWLPKNLTDYLKDECKVLKNEIEKMFNDNEFFKTDLDSSAVKKMAGHLKANWDKLTPKWKEEKVFEKISKEDKKRLKIESSQDLEECDKEQLAQILLKRKTTNFIKDSSEICKRYKLDDIDLIQKLRPNPESENSALLDYIYKRITQKTQKKKDTWLGKCIQEAVSSQTLKLEEIRLPHLNRIDFLDEEQLRRLLEAHIRYWLKDEKHSIKNEKDFNEKNFKFIEVKIIEQKSKVIEQKPKDFQLKLKIFIYSETEDQVRNKLKEEILKGLLENWNSLIFIFRSNQDTIPRLNLFEQTNPLGQTNPFRQMKVYKESNRVSNKVPITDEIADEDPEKKMKFLYEIQKILIKSNLPEQPT